MGGVELTNSGYVCFGLKADISLCNRHVRFALENAFRRSGHQAFSSKANILFQSLFMLITVQLFFFASS